MPEQNDDDLIQSLRARLEAEDTKALAEIFATFQDRLWRMIDLRLDGRLAGRVSPSDVVQDTYLEAAKRLKHFLDKPDMPFFVWLRIVANQRLIEIHRQHLGAKMRDAGMEISLTQGAYASASSACLAARLAGPMTSPSMAAMRLEALARLEAALGELDPIDREVLALRHFEELSNNEVAEVLGIQKAAASKRYVRALERLKTALERVPGLEDLLF